MIAAPHASLSLLLLLFARSLLLSPPTPTLAASAPSFSLPPLYLGRRAQAEICCDGRHCYVGRKGAVQQRNGAGSVPAPLSLKVNCARFLRLWCAPVAYSSPASSPCSAQGLVHALVAIKASAVPQNPVNPAFRVDVCWPFPRLFVAVAIVVIIVPAVVSG